MSHNHTPEELSEEIRAAIRSIPTDILLISAYVLAGVLLLEFLALTPPLRAIIATPLLLFTPGYALVAAAYPRCNDSSGGFALDRSRIVVSTDTGLHAVERVLLSVGMSVALLPIIGVTVWAAVGRFSTDIVLFSLAAFTLGAVAIGAFRRNTLDADERFCLRLWPQIRRFRGWLVGSSTGETAVNVLLAGGVVLAVVTLTFAFAVPVTGESYTSSTLGTEQNGEFVAANYPTTFTAGEPESLTLSLSNHEGGTTSYTVVTTVERVGRSDGELTVVEQSELERSTIRLSAGETVREQSAVAPDLVGEDLRLSYYVYRGQAPETPNDASAYRDLHLWIDVDSP